MKEWRTENKAGGTSDLTAFTGLVSACHRADTGWMNDKLTDFPVNRICSLDVFSEAETLLSKSYLFSDVLWMPNAQRPNHNPSVLSTLLLSYVVQLTKVHLVISTRNLVFFGSFSFLLSTSNQLQGIIIARLELSCYFFFSSSDTLVKHTLFLMRILWKSLK